MTTVNHDGPFIFNGAGDRIPPNGGVKYFALQNPNPAWFECAVTVTALGLLGLVCGPQYLEVVQTATRAGPGPNDRLLDIVVRNNGPRECPYFKVYVGLIRP
jgi:hypothetical protein